jgi:glycosyltransferase involved in cell wall biosynthesis
MLLKYIIKNNIVLVLTLHDCWFFTGKCFHFDSIGCIRWKKKCGQCPKLKDDIPSWFFDKTTRILKEKETYFNQIKKLAVVGVSEWITDLARESILKKGTFYTIKNGVDTDVFKQINTDYKFRYNLKDDFIILGFADKWLNPKNKNIFEVLTNKLNFKHKIILIGFERDEISHIPKNVIAFNYVTSQEKMVELYNLADVFVNLTYNDSFPTVNLESMACGTPVITYNTGGSPESITENTGYIVKQGNFHDIAISITKIKEKGKSFFSSYCLDNVHKNYDSKDCYYKYIKVYRDLVENQ